ncbi:MAG: ImmA/IrrE family metallo-endopeptidase [Hyphomicrobiaceae bacterium]
MDDNFEDDYPVDPLTDEEIEVRAEGWRKALGLSDDESVADVLALLSRASEGAFKLTHGLEIIPKSDGEMGDKEAFAISGPPRIFTRQAVVDAASRHEHRSRMTLVHELAHLVLHPGSMPKARLATRKAAPSFQIKPFRSAERQARRFAAAFLMPRAMVCVCANAVALAARANVSLQAAEIRLQELGLNRTRRQTPSFVADFLATDPDIRPAHKKTWRGYGAAEIQALWNQLEVIPGDDPRSFRRCGRWRIAREQYQMRSECGWHIRDGRIRAHIEDADY